jgi:uncharacterized membrane protein
VFSLTCRICGEARKTLTAWVGVSISAIAVLSEHVEDLYAQIPSIVPLLPQTQYVHTASHWIMGGLGIAVGVTRVRRIIWPPKPKM